jgi:hypothetical protein
MAPVLVATTAVSKCSAKSQTLNQERESVFLKNTWRNKRESQEQKLNLILKAKQQKPNTSRIRLILLRNRMKCCTIYAFLRFVFHIF